MVRGATAQHKPGPNFITPRTLWKVLDYTSFILMIRLFGAMPGYIRLRLVI